MRILVGLGRNDEIIFEDLGLTSYVPIISDEYFAYISDLTLFGRLEILRRFRGIFRRNIVHFINLRCEDIANNFRICNTSAFYGSFKSMY